MINPRTARICWVCDLVTVAATCPLCDAVTDVHPQRNEAQYCVECAKGPFPPEELHLITWEEDPYVQIEDADLIHRCRKCQAEREAEATRD